MKSYILHCYRYKNNPSKKHKVGDRLVSSKWNPKISSENWPYSPDALIYRHFASSRIDRNPNIDGQYYGCLNGIGDLTLAHWSTESFLPEDQWLVIEVDEYVDLGRVVKFPEGLVVFCGSFINAFAYLAKIRPELPQFDPYQEQKIIKSGEKYVTNEQSFIIAENNTKITVGDNSIVVANSGYCNIKAGKYSLIIARGIAGLNAGSNSMLIWRMRGITETSVLFIDEFLENNIANNITKTLGGNVISPSILKKRYYCLSDHENQYDTLSYDLHEKAFYCLI